MQMVMMMMVINIYLTLFTRTPKNTSPRVSICRNATTKTDTMGVLLYILRSYLMVMLFCSTSVDIGELIVITQRENIRAEQQQPTNIVLFGAGCCSPQQKQRFGEFCWAQRRTKGISNLDIETREAQQHPPFSLVTEVQDNNLAQVLRE